MGRRTNKKTEYHAKLHRGEKLQWPLRKFIHGIAKNEERPIITDLNRKGNQP